MLLSAIIVFTRMHKSELLTTKYVEIYTNKCNKGVIVNNFILLNDMKERMVVDKGEIIN